ncbi:MAG: VOC family protein [Gammaproteobacteria bacterium]|nr:VOC family protein [Gammaproteobacteria bacterium]|tara:strand:- start:2001 stop:2492 length:492 start_codon:yes stop_codon:yes gene_type:complete
MKKGFKTTPVSRITLFCRDLEKSLALYRDILGFEEVESKTIQTKAFNELMNIHDKNCFVRISYLQSERSDHGLIALFEINSSELDKNQSIQTTQIQYGQSVIVLSTKDHKKIYRELKKKDYTFLVEPTEYEKLEDSEYIKAGLYKEMSFYDPDGFLINLIEYN